MAKKSGFDRYATLMADWANSIIVDQKTDSFRDAADVSPQLRKQFDEVFRRFSAIINCVENLDLALKFVEARRPRRKDIKLDQYLNYHITAYIQEIYILSERLEQYATLMMRRKKRSTDDARVTERFSQLISQLRDSLEKIIKARGTHVHDRPFDDDSLTMLSTYSLLAPRDERFAKLAAQEYRKAKKIWVETLKNNKKQLDDLLDHYCDFIYEELVPHWSEMLPNNSFKPTPLRGVGKAR